MYVLYNVYTSYTWYIRVIYVIYVLYTCYTCIIRVMYMLYTSYIMPYSCYTCYIRCIYVLHIYYTRYIHVIYVLYSCYTRYIHVIYVLYVLYPLSTLHDCRALKRNNNRTRSPASIAWPICTMRPICKPALLQILVSEDANLLKRSSLPLAKRNLWPLAGFLASDGVNTDVLARPLGNHDSINAASLMSRIATRPVFTPHP